MKVMVMVKATKDSEAGVMPSEQLLSEMGKYNEELMKAGILLAGEGLHPSSKGVRVQFSGTKRAVTDGPFTETKELVAGFWLWQVRSMEEAIAWVKRCPNPMPGESEIEIRPVFDVEDFGEALTPELKEQEERILEKSHQFDRTKSKEYAMQVSPYLNFNGQCEAAFKFYEQCLGGKITAMLPYEGSPAAEHVPPEWGNKILHAHLSLGDWELMGSDAPPEMFEESKGVYVSLQFNDPVEAERIFKDLAENGKVQMPFEETFWAERFAMLVDRFGTPWMINCDRAA